MNRREFLTGSAALYLLLKSNAGIASQDFSRFVWDESYSFNWTHQFPYSLITQHHVVPVDKFQKLHDKMIGSENTGFTTPAPLTQEDYLRVHNADYLKRIETLARNYTGLANGENPLVPQILQFAQMASAGTYAAARIALQEGIAMNLSGGFHHAFPDHEEGFCYLNDVAIAIKKLQDEKATHRAMVIDCDVHHGNGNSSIFLNDPNVFVMDIYQEDNLYPWLDNRFEPDLKINLKAADNITDEKYLAALQGNLARAIRQARPDIVFYLAGADPFKEDRLGGFQLTKSGLQKRDETVLKALRKSSIPVAVVLAGGYAQSIDDVVDIHLNTAQIVRSV